jgi:hypothetical protein
MVSGHFRNFAKVKQFWIYLKRRYAWIDVYVHTWDELGHRNDNNWIDTGYDVKPDLREIEKLLQPIKMLVENNAVFLDKLSLQQPGIPLYYCRFPAILRCRDFSRYIGSQLYSLHAVNSMVRKKEIDNGKRYDIVIRMRADSCLQGLDRMDFIRIFENVRDKQILFVNGSRHHSHPGGGRGCLTCDHEYASGKVRVHGSHTNDVCDAFSYGSSEIMERLCQLHVNAKKLIEKFHEHNTEEIQKHPEIVRYIQKRSEELIVVTHHDVFEKHIKCYYPERLIREMLPDVWILSDPYKVEPLCFSVTGEQR